MKTFNEIDVTAKRASKAAGFSWGVAEEIGKNIRLLEVLGLPGIKNLNQYFKIYKKQQFQNISLITKFNTSKISYCPIIVGVNLLDQITVMEELDEINFENVAFPVLIIPFLSRASEIIGKKIMLVIDDQKFLLNFNQSIYSNYSFKTIIEKAKKIKINFLENTNSFSENDWEDLCKLTEDTFVEETEELKQKTAGAGLIDND
jgi:hypothetical protein|tara:strand:+ start:1424 stop:2032 length:609 start_codon:yes stop_codon:yes gene_type:complete